MISEQKQKSAFDTLKGEFGYTNVMASPKLVKIVVSSGTGKAKDKARNALVEKKLALITGQKPAVRVARKSIASFKLREGEIVGYQVTLRGQRMYEFLDKLVHIALPRTRDFRGLSKNSIDEMGNYTIGIRENSIFPETSEEDLKDVFGLSITLVTTAKNKKDAEAFIRHLDIPMQA